MGSKKIARILAALGMTAAVSLGSGAAAFAADPLSINIRSGSVTPFYINPGDKADLAINIDVLSHADGDTFSVAFPEELTFDTAISPTVFAANLSWLPGADVTGNGPVEITGFDGTSLDLKINGDDGPFRVIVLLALDTAELPNNTEFSNLDPMTMTADGEPLADADTVGNPIGAPIGRFWTTDEPLTGAFETTKTGEWVDADDQGLEAPEGAIKYAVRTGYYAMPYSLTDTVGAGLAMDCDSIVVSEYNADADVDPNAQLNSLPAPVQGYDAPVLVPSELYSLTCDQSGFTVVLDPSWQVQMFDVAMDQPVLGIDYTASIDDETVVSYDNRVTAISELAGRTSAPGLLHNGDAAIVDRTVFPEDVTPPPGVPTDPPGEPGPTPEVTDLPDGDQAEEPDPASAATEGLPGTGADANLFAVIGALSLLGGLALVVLNRRRSAAEGVSTP